MDWTIFLGLTAAASLVTGLVAWIVARQIAAARELTAWPILIAIVISLAVLQGAAKLAVLVDGLFARTGIDPATALAGQFRIMVYGASFLPIAAYVVTFLLVYRRVKGAEL